MFVPEPMREVRILTTAEDVEAVTLALARLGVLEIAEEEIPPEWRLEKNEEWGRLANEYATYLREIEAALHTLQITPAFTPPEELAPQQDIERIKQEFAPIRADVDAWENKKTALEKDLEQNRSLLQQLNLLQPLDIPVERLHALTFVTILLGTLPRENLPRLRRALYRIPFTLIPVRETRDQIAIIAITNKENEDAMRRALRSAFWSPITLPDNVRGAPRDAMRAVEQDIQTLQEQLQALEEERHQLAYHWREDLLSLWAKAQANIILTTAMQKFGRRGMLRLITGWVPAHALDRLIATLQEVTSGRAVVEVVEPYSARAQAAPTLLRVPRLLKPFASLVTTFGVPNYTELNPTPLVAVTFLLMYGMMFGDIGHGLLLALVGLFLWKRRRLGEDLALLIIMAGLSGTFFGLLYGSVFGIEDLLPALWAHPMKDMGQILVGSIIAGIFLLNVGFLLNLINAWRQRDWERFWFQKNGVAGWLLYWALLGGIAVWYLGYALPTSVWAGLALISALAQFLHQPLGRLLSGARPLLSEGWGNYSVEAFFELFEAVISYISNSLSFIRLGAFAVAHAGLSQVVFILADMVGGIGSPLVILLGTLFIVGFEGLIVGIQTLRLEYYEFFGKFFGGRGRLFRPLRLPHVTPSTGGTK